MGRIAVVFLFCLTVVGAGAGAQAQSQQTPENAFVKKLSTAADEAAQGDIALALRDSRAAIAIDPKQSEGWYALGSMLGQTGDFQGAESALRRAIELKPDLAKAHYSLALTLIGNPQGKMDWAGAITECREALKYRPEYPQALNLLGAGLAATGQADEAIQVLQHAIRLLPDSTEAHFTLAACGATSHFPTRCTTAFDGATSILMSVRGTATVSSRTLRPA